MSTTTAAKTWLSKREATRILRVGPKCLARLAVEGRIRFREIPGSWVKFYAEDVFRLAEPTSTSTLQSA